MLSVSCRFGTARSQGPPLHIQPARDNRGEDPLEPFVARAMILQHVAALNRGKVVLASKSPRRLEILNNVVNSTFAEDLDKTTFTAPQYATETAYYKALDVASTLADVRLVIAADTVVECDGRILEKPQDGEHAKAMLSSLSGRQHKVHTGVALVFPEDEQSRVEKFVETTCVTFAALDAEEIAAYIETGEPFGKAGAYGIQGAAGAWVSHIEGCYFNVMGFPLHRFAVEVSKRIQAGRLKL